MTSDIKAGRRASSRDTLRANTVAAFDLSHMSEAITKTPSPVKRILIYKSLAPVLSTIQ